jgi:hypothetical protein
VRRLRGSGSVTGRSLGSCAVVAVGLGSTSITSMIRVVGWLRCLGRARQSPRGEARQRIRSMWTVGVIVTLGSLRFSTGAVVGAVTAILVVVVVVFVKGIAM